jgi:hypothetical protein
VIPDLSVICDKSKIREKGCVGAPDLVVEILLHRIVRIRQVKRDRRGVADLRRWAQRAGLLHVADHCRGIDMVLERLSRTMIAIGRSVMSTRFFDADKLKFMFSPSTKTYGSDLNTSSRFHLEPVL